MKLSARVRIGNEIDLPTPTAFWVLGAHLCALLSAVPMMLLMERHDDALATTFASPALIYAGLAMYTAGVAFECAQNTFDRWYLTHTDESFCDCLFYTFMIGGFSLMSAGASNLPWIRATAAVIAVAHPFFYVAGSWVRYPLLTAALLLVDYAMFRALGDPVVFVHTLAKFAGLYFLALLMLRRAQWFHGCAAFCFGVSMFAFPWAVDNYVTGQPVSWLTLGKASAVLVVALGALWPVWSKMAATGRKQLSRSQAPDGQLVA